MTPPLSRPVLSKRYRPLVVSAIAFLSLLSLIVVLAVNSIVQLNHAQRLNAVVQDHAHKINVITRIQLAANRRTESLLRMALTQDPFERDAVFMEFNRAAFDVGNSRLALQRLGLDADEAADFARQTTLVKRIQTTQEAVTDLVNAGQLEAAMRLLKTQALPLQNQFNAQLAKMRSRDQDDTQTAQSDAGRQFARTWNLTAALGVAAVLLGAAVGWFRCGIWRATHARSPCNSPSSKNRARR
jgi:hypothetical protein